MNRQNYYAYELSDFPLSSGVFAPSSQASLCEIVLNPSSAFGRPIQEIKDRIELRKLHIEKGAHVISRIRYEYIDKTRNDQGEVELIGVEVKPGVPKFFVASKQDIKSGNLLDVKFSKVLLNDMDWRSRRARPAQATRH